MDDTPDRSRGTFPFTSLPTEIRFEVYKELLSHSGRIYFSRSRYSPSFEPFGLGTYTILSQDILRDLTYLVQDLWKAGMKLLKTCRLIADEATQVLYANTFRFRENFKSHLSWYHDEDPYHLDFFQTIGKQNVYNLRRLEFALALEIDNLGRPASSFQAVVKALEIIAQAKSLRSLVLDCSRWRLCTDKVHDDDSPFLLALKKLRSLPLLKVRVEFWLGRRRDYLSTASEQEQARLAALRLVAVQVKRFIEDACNGESESSSVD